MDHETHGDRNGGAPAPTSWWTPRFGPRDAGNRGLAHILFAALAVLAGSACTDREPARAVVDTGRHLGARASVDAGRHADARPGVARPEASIFRDGGAATRVIFDTDMGPDVDDAGALAVLHALTDNGEVELLGVVISTTNGDGNPAISFVDAVNTYYGRPDVKIGLYGGGAFAYNDRYTSDVASNPSMFPHDLGPSKNDVPDAAMLYRELLAAEADGNVTIVCVGPMNVLHDLLASPPDSVSSSSGAALVAAKVRLLVQMGGDYPTGAEFNFAAQPAPGTTRSVLEAWPTPMVFSGFSIGGAIMTGASLARVPADNPVRRAYEIYTGTAGGTRQSWDLTAALYAARGPASYWALSSPGINRADDAGNNTWTASPDGNHAYLQMLAAPDDIAETLNALMTRAPGR
jgi:inosine-uridine nucleoside N-ribohydrolase